MSIEKLVKSHVKSFAEDYWKEDVCPPVFLVSYDLEQELLVITCTHSGSSYSATINSFEDINKKMEELYNQTM